jgi:hydrogenase maturation protease
MPLAEENSDVFVISADIIAAAHCLIFMNCEATIETEFLVIGYGNTLRGDDGIGPRVAEAVGHLRLPGVRTLICPLLTPELADPISRASTVIFVDAAVDAPNEVLWRKLEPNETSQLMAHAANPRTMLALARDVFGRVPEAWWLTIPALDLGFREDFSPGVQKKFAEAVKKIQAFCRSSQLN